MCKITGYHALIDVSNLAFSMANDCAFWLKLLLKTAEEANTKVIDVVRKKFEPHGCSGILLISESHLSFHSFPEIGSVHLDYYTCGTYENFQRGLSYLLKEIAYIPRVIIKVYKVERMAFSRDASNLLDKN